MYPTTPWRHIMLRNACWITCVALFATTGSATAQAPLDLLPSDAMVGCAIRNLSDFKKKADKFAKDADLQRGFPMQPSQLLDQAYKALGLQGVIDEDNSCAIVFVAEKVVGVPLGRF